MSGGRVELGLGTGWYDGEHTAYGIPFPRWASGSTAWRSSSRSSPGCGHAAGQDVRLRGRPLPAGRLAGPAQAGAVAAPADHARRRRQEAHAGPGRPLRRRVQLRRSRRWTTSAAQFDVVPGGVRGGRPRPGDDDVLGGARCCAWGRTRPRSARRAEAIGQCRPTSCGRHGLGGDGAGGGRQGRAFATAGAERVYLQMFDLTDLDHLRLVAEEVVPGPRVAGLASAGDRGRPARWSCAGCTRRSRSIAAR